MPITLVQEATSFSNMPGVSMEILPMVTVAVLKVLCLPFYSNLSNE